MTFALPKISTRPSAVCMHNHHLDWPIGSIEHPAVSPTDSLLGLGLGFATQAVHGYFSKGSFCSRRRRVKRGFSAVWYHRTDHQPLYRAPDRRAVETRGMPLNVPQGVMAQKVCKIYSEPFRSPKRLLKTPRPVKSQCEAFHKVS